VSAARPLQRRSLALETAHSSEGAK